MITRRLFLGGLLVAGSTAPSVVPADSIMSVKVPRIIGPWEPPPWTLVPGFDYDAPWYERVGDGYCVWSVHHQESLGLSFDTSETAQTEFRSQQRELNKR